MDIKEKKKRQTPPYLSGSKIEETLRLLANRNFKSIEGSTFEGYGFGRAESLLAFNMLRFLSLIDDSGKPTENMESVRLQGDARKKSFEKIIRGAYRALFEIVPAPEKLPPEELNNDFVTRYKVSSRVARSAVPAFLKLAEIAGLVEEGTVITRKRGPKKGSKKISEKDKAQSSYEGTPAIKAGLVPLPVAGMILLIPSWLKDKLLTDESVEKHWKALRTALKEFADELMPEPKATQELDDKPEEEK